MAVTNGVATAVPGSVTAASLIHVPPGPCTVQVVNAGSSPTIYLGSAGNIGSVSTGSWMPVPSGLVPPFEVGVYAGAPAGTWSVATATGGGTATVAWWISSPSGGTGP